ncbi:hypothetical protein Cylst_4364 [Cylindrospermum stagnale PCC 7417]|uniref:eCIS core domain-containing protein n=1 Tax=Cylindrospermum stagnale PCC 7417 TaxID=56107 RepID=K9X1F7_9NOST|nr:DUF4157 domain-containing protein [Cylindrospermum stagnale]AFZ26455.1 hypothetical protein Cylst_4364 [Cylindrospermum stagnale PCC 7417]
MYSRQHRTAKNSSNSSDTQAPNQFAPRRFVVQPKTEASQPQQEQTPDIEAQQEETKQYKGGFIDFSKLTPRPTPPKTPRIQMKLTLGQPGNIYQQQAVPSNPIAIQPKANTDLSPAQNPTLEPFDKAEEVSNEAVELRQMSESGESGDEDANSPNGGNVQRACSLCDSEKSLFQTKLTIGAPGDKYEQEADSMAQQVMSMDTPTVQQQPIQRQEEELSESIQKQPLSASITPLVQRFAKAKVQAKSNKESIFTNKESYLESTQLKALPAKHISTLNISPGAQAKWLNKHVHAEKPTAQEQPIQRLTDETLQRSGKSDATPATPSLESRLGSQTGGGTPLDEQTRSFMEPRFGADFNQVRVHTDTTAVQMNKELGAQAFAHGSDIYFGAGKTPGKNELTAHELTHVVQQGGAVRMNPAKKLVNPQVSAKINKEPGIIPKQDHSESAQLKPLEAKQLPTDATSRASNKDLYRFPHETQALQAKQLPNSDTPLDSNKEKRPLPQQDHQLVQSKHISTLSVSPRIQGDWFHDRKRELLDQVEQRLKDIPGYDLLLLALGRNPITGEAVERNGTKAVGTFLKLVPGGDQIFEKLQQSGALEKAFTWWQDEITKLNITIENIKGLVNKAIDSLGLSDITDVSGAIEKVKGFFKPTIERVKNFATNVGNKVLEFTLEGFMQGAGGAVSQVMAILKKAGNVFGTIASDPIKFCQNLMKAVTGGFEQFKNNFSQHFQTGMMKWLFGTLATAGLTAPSEFNAQGLISIALEVLGITYQKIRLKLVNKVGEKKLAKAEQGVEILQKILQGGLAQAWQNISELMENVEQQKEEMIGKLKDMVVEAVIGAAIPKLLVMFVPGGAIIEAVMNVYKTITFFIDKAQEIAELANAVFDSIGNIAAGNLAAASSKVETVMGRSLSLIISFLAKLIGVGNLGYKVRKLLENIKGKIDEALDKLVTFIADKVKVFLKNPGQNNQPAVVPGQNNQPRGSQTQHNQQPNNSPQNTQQNQSPTSQRSDGEVGKTINFTAKGESHSLWIEVVKTLVKVMVASTPEQVKTKLDKWQGRLNELQGNNRTKAEKSLNIAYKDLGITQKEAQEAVKEKQKADSAPGNQKALNEFIQADSETEAAQDNLADALKELFELFGEENTLSQKFIETRNQSKAVINEVRTLCNQRRQLIQAGKLESQFGYNLDGYESALQNLEEEWKSTKGATEKEPGLYELAVEEFDRIKTEVTKLKAQIQKEIPLKQDSQTETLPNEWSNIKPNLVYKTDWGLVSFADKQIAFGKQHDLDSKHLQAINKGKVAPKGSQGLVPSQLEGFDLKSKTIAKGQSHYRYHGKFIDGVNVVLHFPGKISND